MLGGADSSLPCSSPVLFQPVKAKLQFLLKEADQQEVHFGLQLRHREASFTFFFSHIAACMSGWLQSVRTQGWPSSRVAPLPSTQSHFGSGNVGGVRIAAAALLGVRRLSLAQEGWSQGELRILGCERAETG